MDYSELMNSKRSPTWIPDTAYRGNSGANSGGWMPVVVWVLDGEQKKGPKKSGWEISPVKFCLPSRRFFCVWSFGVWVNDVSQ